MKAVVFDRFGEPGEVLQVKDVPLPEPGAGQVRVRMIASPINPSDLLVVRGRYGVLPKLPATPGFEGVGIVDKVGPGLLGKLVAGKRVVAINDKGGNWAEYAIINARQARPVPADIPDEQAASFFVNPATVLAMVRYVLNVPKGAWLLQSAANSNLGRMVIRLARQEGMRTVNVVRHEALVPELKKLGADAVVVAPGDSEGLEARIREAVAGETIRHAIDPVGGEIGTGVLNSLGLDGHLLLYGSLSERPIQLASRHTIARHLKVEGFWLGHWVRSRTIPQNLILFRQIFKLIREGVLSTEVGESFQLGSIHEAVKGSEKPGNRSKVLLRCS